MISILTSFKPFVGDDAVRQTNALASWRALHPEIEIVAFGTTPGLSPLAERFRVRRVEDAPAFEGRLPFVAAMVDFARLHCVHDLQLLVNGDILLFGDILRALCSIPLKRFVMLGRRLDVDLSGLIDLSDEATREETRGRLTARSRLHDPGGLDYFAWRRGSLPQLPPLSIGAAGWDNITVYLCRKARVPVIDATPDVCVFHQEHEHHRTPEGLRAAYEGPAAIANLRQVEDRGCRFYTTDASHVLRGGRIRPALLSPEHAWRMIATYPLLHGWGGSAEWPFRLAGAVVRRMCCMKKPASAGRMR